MLTQAHLGTLPIGTRGFDCDQTLTAEAAHAFFKHGYRFAVRYVRRRDYHTRDLTQQEAHDILYAGLGLMLVQHVAPAPWLPTPGLGMSYGAIAASEASIVGVPAGTMIWCDLEGVNRAALAADTIGYCNRWYDAVKLAGFLPGLYVGDSCGLSALQLYRSLKFSNYWGAYNLNSDQIPAVRGLQMRQMVAKSADLVPGFDLAELDIDRIMADALGGTPTVLLPDNG